MTGAEIDSAEQLRRCIERRSRWQLTSLVIRQPY